MKALKSTLLASVPLLVLLIQSPLVESHLPELYGREYVRVEGRPNAPIPELAAKPLPVPSREDQAQHEQLLDDAELSNGPYAIGLTDPLINLGSYHSQRGQTEKAVQAYRRALHLVRINDGLYSPLQIPILRELMKAYRAAGDHESLGNAYQYYYRVGNLGSPPETKKELEERLEYLNWERELYASRPGSRAREHLLQAYEANAQLLETLNPATSVELDWYLRLAMSQMLNLYLILSDDPLSMHSYNANSSQGMAADLINQKIGVMQQFAYGRGKTLLEGCIEQGQSLPPEDLAALHLELGDWSQWNGSLQRAGEQYTRVEELLNTAGEQQLLEQWLGEPVELPDESELWQLTQDADSSAPVIVTAQYRVNSRGDVKRVTVSVADEEESWRAARIKRMLKDTHFRPRFSEGSPQAMENISRRYTLID